MSSLHSAPLTSARCTTCEATLAAADPKQRAGRAGLQEYVQAVQLAAHAHDGRCLLQTGDEGAVRARRLRAGIRTISMGRARLTMRSI